MESEGVVGTVGLPLRDAQPTSNWRARPAPRGWGWAPLWLRALTASCAVPCCHSCAAHVSCSIHPPSCSMPFRPPCLACFFACVH
eukprot:11223549-Alexandrium_andersonii.AAC.1